MVVAVVVVAEGADEAVDRRMVVVVEAAGTVHLAVEGTAADIAHEAPDTDLTDETGDIPLRKT